MRRFIRLILFYAIDMRFKKHLCCCSHKSQKKYRQVGAPLSPISLSKYNFFSLFVTHTHDPKKRQADIMKVCLGGPAQTIYAVCGGNFSDLRAACPRFSRDWDGVVHLGVAKRGAIGKKLDISALWSVASVCLPQQLPDKLHRFTAEYTLDSPLQSDVRLGKGQQEYWNVARPEGAD